MKDQLLKLGWVEIARDRDGFATQKALDEMYSSLPIEVLYQWDDGKEEIETVEKDEYEELWNIEKKPKYKAYRKI